jgi:hypothetical protein
VAPHDLICAAMRFGVGFRLEFAGRCSVASAALSSAPGELGLVRLPDGVFIVQPPLVSR